MYKVRAETFCFLDTRYRQIGQHDSQQCHLLRRHTALSYVYTGHNMGQLRSNDHAIRTSQVVRHAFNIRDITVAREYVLRYLVGVFHTRLVQFVSEAEL